MIVDKRSIVVFLYAAAVLFCLFSMNWVKVQNDVTKYLPDDTETLQGITAMNENFDAFSTARIMISNVTYDTAQELFEQIQTVDGVTMVVFDNTVDHYKNATALIDVNFDGPALAQSSLDAMEEIRGMLSNYDVQIDTLVGYDENATLREEMATILVVAVIIIIVVLVLTSRTFAEVLVLLITFGVAALLNMGTNFIFDEISFISDSIAVVLQLALAIDYAIILCHRFTDERETKDARQACITALKKSIPEISASSLTTICGLTALAFMKFSIGMDMAVVLIKSIFLSLITVFTLMPCLLMLFAKAMERTKHKRLLPNVHFLGKFAVKTRRFLPILFFGVIIAGFVFSSQCPYAYSYNDLKTSKMTERQVAYFNIKETFGTSNMAAVIVPAGDYVAESEILAELEACPEVKSTMGLSGIEALGGYKLTDALTPRQLSELMDMDYETTELLYGLYAAENSQYGQIVNGLGEYKIPMLDIFLFLKDTMESNNIVLEGEQGEEIQALFTQLETASQQLQSEKYSRMVVYLNVPEEGEETYQFLEKMRTIIGQHYPEDYYVVGNSTSSRDLSDSFANDNLMISILSAVFVIIVLLFTFRSVGLSILLIMVIQGSIWINFSIPAITDQPLYFLGYLIVNAVMMGANIDYAIVISSHYQENKKIMPYKEAIKHAVNSAFPTVFTSGTMMASAGLLIGSLSAQPVVSIMGNCLGRGTIISIFLVLCVLPSILVLGDSIINKTSFRFKSATQTNRRQETGELKVNGRIRGYVCGEIDAQISGVVKGELDAVVLVSEEKEGEHV